MSRHSKVFERGPVDCPLIVCKDNTRLAPIGNGRAAGMFPGRGRPQKEQGSRGMSVRAETLWSERCGGNAGRLPETAVPAMEP